MRLSLRIGHGVAVTGLGIALAGGGCGGAAFDGGDGCMPGDTECVDTDVMRKCIGSTGDEFWLETECVGSQRCTIVDQVAACR